MRNEYRWRCDLVFLGKLDTLARQKTPVQETTQCKASYQQRRGPSWRTSLETHAYGAHASTVNSTIVLGSSLRELHSMDGTSKVDALNEYN